MSYSSFAIAWHVTYAAAVMLSYAIFKRALPFIFMIGVCLPFTYYGVLTFQSWKTFAIASLPFLLLTVDSTTIRFLPRALLCWIGCTAVIFWLLPPSSLEDTHSAVQRVFGNTAIAITSYLAAAESGARLSRWRSNEATILIARFSKYALFLVLSLAGYAILQQGLYYATGYTQAIPTTNQLMRTAFTTVGSTGVYRSSGIYVEPKLLADQLNIGLLLVALFYPRSRAKWWICTYICLGIVFTWSTSGIIGTAVILLWAMPWIDASKGRRVLTYTIISALIIVAMVAGSGVMVGTENSGTFSLGVAFRERTIDRLYSDRFEVDFLISWFDVARVNAILTGAGFSAYNYAIASATGEVDMFTNSGLIRMFVETGVIGVVLYMLWLYQLSTRIRRERNDFVRRSLKACIAAGVYSLVVDSVAPLVFIAILQMAAEVPGSRHVALAREVCPNKSHHESVPV